MIFSAKQYFFMVESNNSSTAKHKKMYLLSDPLWPSCSSPCSHFPLTSFATCHFCSDAWSPYHNRCHWLMKEFHLFPLELRELWRWHGQCWRRSVLVGLELTAPADLWGRDSHWPEPIVPGCLGKTSLCPWHSVRVWEVSTAKQGPRTALKRPLLQIFSPASIC